MPRSQQNNHNGAIGEKIAVEKLLKSGYRILTCNYHSRFGEIDIIACDERYIVFVEVKTREQTSRYHPFEAITKAKQKKIGLTAQDYLQRKPSSLQPRFDAIAVIMNKDKIVEVSHLQNAFML